MNSANGVPRLNRYRRQLIRTSIRGDVNARLACSLAECYGTTACCMDRFRRKKYLLVLLMIATLCFVIFGSIRIDHDYRVALTDVRVDLNVSALSKEFEEFMSHQEIGEAEKSDFFFYEKRVSDEIGAFRELPDTRDHVCRERVYNVPRKTKVSVIIVYRNEARSSLVRTILSVIVRTPKRYLNEIIVIDDCSDDETSTADLAQLPLGTFIKLYRNRQHEGVIESRNLGAKIATGDYIVFLDSHCEVNVGWLEPLLDRLATFYGMAVSPVLDSIDATTFQYRASSKNLKGGFDWNLHFRWIPVGEKERESKTDPSDPFTSPAFSGGVFMISRNWFFKLNGFNTFLKVWGGESIEMSIKLWLCGGQIEIVPCSRVGHVFQKTTHSLDVLNGQYLRNRKIIAESWLDEYKYFFYSSTAVGGRGRGHATAAIPGNGNDTQGAVEKMKRDLQCRPFAWYRQTIFYELKLPNEDYIAFGKLSSGQKCLKIVPAASGVVAVAMKNCYHSNVTHWFLSAKDGRLHSNTGACLNVKDSGSSRGGSAEGRTTVVLQYCKSLRNKSQSWMRMGGKLIHVKTGLCLDNLFSEVVTMSKCRRGAPSQLFSFSVELQTQWGM